MENERYLSTPDFCTIPPLRLTQDDRETVKEALKAAKVFSELILSSIKKLKGEEILLKGLIRRNQRQFVNDKGFKDLKMIVKTLRRFNDIKLNKLILDFYSSFPTTFNIMEKPPESLALVKQSDLRVVIIRIYQSIVLLEKIRDVYTLNAGENCFKRMRLGHHWSLALAWLGSVSRICSLVSNSIINLMKDTYDDLMSLYALNILGGEDTTFEPNKLNLPPKFGDKTRKETSNEILLEVGVVVERKSEVQMSESMLKRGRLIVKTFSAFKVKSSLLDWIKQETEQRKVNRKKSLTKPLSAEKWKSFRKQLGTSSLKDARNLLLLYVLYPESSKENGFPSNWNEILKTIISKS
ncbi:uncharacterized protein [Lepeophtheirus salmonis]|uniref:uncharacterized protein n=1 Tax=Lepeophtheirus salmonis TaxID=72036 RepID=UPI001AE8E3DC|nr:uncharacterized protein LOC121126187 isoform X1 [Lepeophtheirus salmonis]